MSGHTEPDPHGVRPLQAQLAGQHARRENLTTHQMRTIGQRRADAEGKLARHLHEAHRRAGEHLSAAENPLGDESAPSS